MTHRISVYFLWIALFLTIPVGRLRDLAGPETLICGYAVFAVLFIAAVWKVGAAKKNEGRVREHHTFLPGVLLVAGPIALLLGASVTGEPTASRPGDYLLNTTAILLGSLILIGGFVTLSAKLWEAGQRLLPMLGLAGLLAGAAVWFTNLLFRYAVVASGASGLQAELENRAWVANEYLRGLEGVPAWMELLLVWTDMLQLAFVLLAYLAAAALGASSVSAGWLGRIGGGIFVGLNLALALAVTLGIVLAGYGSAVGAWTAYMLTIPFMVFVSPYFLGLAFLRDRDGKNTRRKGGIEVHTPATQTVRGA